MLKSEESSGPRGFGTERASRRPWPRAAAPGPCRGAPRRSPAPPPAPASGAKQAMGMWTDWGGGGNCKKGGPGGWPVDGCLFWFLC